MNKEGQEREYAENFYRINRIGDKFLASTDSGDWTILTKTQLAELRSGNLSDNTYKIAKETGLIITEENLPNILANTRKRLQPLYRSTGLHIIVTTLRCNHKCLYCHSHPKTTQDEDYDLKHETAERIIDFIFQCPSNNLTIEFQGGESLLNVASFKDVVNMCKEKNKEKKRNLTFVLVTNLSLMNEETAQWLKDEKIVICTSVDGPEILHNKNRPTESSINSHQKTIEWMKKLKIDYGIDVGALMVTTKSSLPHWKEIIDEYRNIGLNTIQLKPLNKLGFAENKWKEVGYEFEEFEEFWKKSMDYILELNKKNIIFKERYVEIILKKLFMDSDPGFTDFASPCGLITGQLTYDYNGDIFSCDEGRNFDLFKLGNVNNTKYIDVIRSKESQQLVNASTIENYICDMCAYKPFCGTCVVNNYAREGNIIPNIPSNFHHKLFKMMFDWVFNVLINRPEDAKLLSRWCN